MQALASSPFASDPECLALALRIIKEGAPDFNDSQMRKVFSSKKGQEDWFKLEKCKKKRGGLDFSCFVNEFLSDDFDELKQCWQTKKDPHICAPQILRACDAIHTAWNKIVASGVDF